MLRRSQFGQYRQEVWDTGHRIALAEYGLFDVPHQMPHIANAIVYSNHSLNQLRDAVMHLYQVRRQARAKVERQPEFDAAVVLGEVECPLVQVSRLYHGACTANPAQLHCQESVIIQADQVLSDAEGGACHWMLRAEPDALLFRPVPASEFQEKG